MYVSRRSSSEGLPDLSGTVIILTGIALFFAGKFLTSMVQELYWLYTERSALGPQAARRIRQAFGAMAAILLCVLGAWLVVPAASGALGSIAVWSGLAFVAFVEFIQHRAQRRLGDPGALNSYLPPKENGSTRAA